ncbi:Hsp70 family protein [Argonema antarcticum]|uniref:Hsp70 family protein n=1 Tax=Argonema antarcticum TaxID=2942763 RepID=UPI0020110F21|nr:Hsp70 family protein [Argonema antarcticum]MCL1470080.1 Hsp70 family protein [Argonema antarcticum A004/B2]
MTYAVGIDLGTTNSVVSIFRRGVVETIAIDGRSTMPSVVSWRDDGSVLVGQAAKSRLLLDPENTIASAKRFMGDRNKFYRIGGKFLSPLDISSMVLKILVEGTRKALGEDIRDAVITVPAYFTEAQREDTKRAGEEAGLNVLRLIPEPTAAAIAYGLDKNKDQTIMVYDLGGGTFDVSILLVQGNRFEVKAVGGDSHLGGDDFDRAIVNWASQTFQEQTGIDLQNDPSREGTIARQRLKEAAENAKIELSISDRATIAIPDCLGYPLELEISVSEYNNLIAPLLRRTVDCMKSVLQDALLKPQDIDRVILVGGSTKNRAVREIVAKEIKEPYTSDRVDEVVAHGAAIAAANLSLPDLVPLDVLDVTAHSLGVSMLNKQDELVFKPIIPRQTAYPCRRGIIGYTNRALQNEIDIPVFRGENNDPKFNECLGLLSLPVSPPHSEIVPVAAIFDLDADGIIHFTAVQLPAISQSLSIIEKARKNQGVVDLTAVDSLVENGEAYTKVARIMNR